MSGGGGQQTTTSQGLFSNPQGLALAQQAYASGALAPNQNFQLHEGQLDPLSQQAQNFTSSLSNGGNGNFNLAQNAANDFAYGTTGSDLYSQLNQIYNQIVGGVGAQSQGLNNSPGWGALNQFANGNFGSSLNNLISSGQLSGLGSLLGNYASNGLLGGSGQGYSNFAYGGGLGGAGDMLGNFATSGQLGGAGGALSQLASSGVLNGMNGEDLAALANSGQLKSTAGNTLTNIANGSELNLNNPEFQNMVTQQAQKAQAAIDSQYAQGGRYGSGVFANAATSNAQNIASQLGYQQYQQGLADRLAAATTLGNYQTGAQNLLGQFQNQGIQNLGSLQAGALNNLFSTQANAMGNIYNAQQGALGNLYNTQANAATQGAGLQNSAAQSQSGMLNQQFLQQLANQLSAAQGLSQNATNQGNFQLQGIGNASNLLNQQQTGALNAAGIQQQFQLGRLADIANQYNYNQSQPGLGLLNFSNLFKTGQSTTQNTGGSGTGGILGGILGGLGALPSILGSSGGASGAGASGLLGLLGAL